MSGISFPAILRSVIFLFACPWVAVGAQASSEGVGKWLEDLGDERYAVRDAAHREIWNYGSSALPMLRKLAEEKQDPERMMRARDLIRKIVFEITPETDARLIGWIEAYETASVSEKEKIMSGMKGKRAWLPMLRLFAAERDANTRAKLLPILDGVAVRAAREKLAAGDPGGAQVALELAPVDASSLLALAVFHRNQGRWDEVWEKLDEEGRSGPWGLALLRAADRVAEARSVAAELGYDRLAGWLGALDGDPLDWLEKVNPTMDESEALYVELAKRRWRGEEPRSEDWERLVKRANGRGESVRKRAIQTLFLLAKPSLAESAFIKHMPLAAFLHYEQSEQVPQALMAMGLDPEKPDYGSWYRTKFEKYQEDDIEDQHEVNTVGAELVAMSGFLERKGLDEVLWDAFSQPLLAYAERDEMGFLNLLSMLFGGRGLMSVAPAFSARIGETWAGENEDRWSEVRTCALGDEGDVSVWWEWLGRHKPGMTHAERLRVKMALHGVGADPRGLKEQWVPRILKAAKEEEDLVKRVLQLAMETQDAALYVEAEGLLDQATRDRMFWGVRINFLSALDRWGDVADVLLQHLETQKASGRVFVSEIHLYAYAASALRLAGRGEEAVQYDAMAEALYLGEPAYALRIGHGYAFGRDYKRAMVWWKRACVESDMEFSEFGKALNVLADGWLEAGEWLRAASLYECSTRLNMNSEDPMELPMTYTQHRLCADTARAISRLKTNRADAIAALGRTHEAFLTAGSLADVFFPLLRRAGLVTEHNRWFDKTWAAFRGLVDTYPASDNTRNTAAWMSARALRELDAGMEDIQAALARRPGQAAYMDTKAEIYFAMGDRKRALQWSAKAMAANPEDFLIRKQHARFLLEPLPR